MNGRVARLIILAVTAGAFLFLLAPMLVVMGASLDGTASAYFRFPPHDLSLHWYAAIPAKYWSSLGQSFAIALVASVVSNLIGLLAALGIARGTANGSGLLETYFRFPLQVPFVVTGVVFLQFYYALFEWTGIELVGRYWGFVIAHIFFCIPYSVGAIGSVIGGGLERIENAARIAGATEARVFRRVTLPALKPGLFSGFFFAFIASFGDVPVSVFLSSGGVAPLPVEIFQTLQFDYDPTVLAVSTLVVIGSSLFILAMQRLAGLDAVAPRA